MISKKAESKINPELAISNFTKGLNKALNDKLCSSGFINQVSNFTDTLSSTILQARSPSNSPLVNRYLSSYKKRLRKFPSAEEMFSAADAAYKEVVLQKAINAYKSMLDLKKLAEEVNGVSISSSVSNTSEVNSLASELFESTNYYIKLTSKIEYYFNNINEKAEADRSVFKQLLARRYTVVGIGIDAGNEAFSDNDKKFLFNLGTAIADVGYFISTFEKNIRYSDSGSLTGQDSIEFKGKKVLKPLDEKEEKREKQEPSQHSYQIENIFQNNDFKSEVSSSGNLIVLNDLHSKNPELRIQYSGGISNDPKEVLASIINSGLIKPGADASNIFEALRNATDRSKIVKIENDNGTTILNIRFLNNILDNFKNKEILKIIVKTNQIGVFANKKYTINSGIKKISFDINDIINESSNISSLERTLIIKKIKK
jgi:hypothetical protein